jgi:sulfate permease, SulP family
VRLPSACAADHRAVSPEPQPSRERADRRSPAASPDAAVLLRRFVPIVRWLPAYRREHLGPDMLAGITAWGVMVPVALAYASLAGLPPEYGLITAFAALAAYAVFGTSRHLRVTTSSTMAIMSVSLVTPLAAGDASRFLALTAALALVVGGLLLVAGVARLGFISEFLARPVVTGFIVGVAITIIVGQLPKLLGVPGSSGSVVDQLRALVGHLPETDPLTLCLGAGALALILGLRAVDRRIPGAFIAMVVGIALVSLLDLGVQGVAIVGDVATLMPRLGLPDVGLGDLVYLVTGAAGIVFLAVGESLGAARGFAARHGYEVEADQELVALGAANTASGLFGGFIVDASLSQSATAEAAGARSQLSGLLTAGLVLATALLLAPLFESLPWAVLGAIVIASRC